MEKNLVKKTEKKIIINVVHRKLLSFENKKERMKASLTL